jgi:hypothetical protein
MQPVIAARLAIAMVSLIIVPPNGRRSTRSQLPPRDPGVGVMGHLAHSRLPRGSECSSGIMRRCVPGHGPPTRAIPQGRGEVAGMAGKTGAITGGNRGLRRTEPEQQAGGNQSKWDGTGPARTEADRRAAPQKSLALPTELRPRICAEMPILKYLNQLIQRQPSSPPIRRDGHQRASA